MLAELTPFFWVQPTLAGNFEGTLYRRGSRDPIAQASIFILPHKIKTTTDDRGRYQIPEVPAGEFQWVINLSGYEKIEKPDQSTESTVPEKRDFFIERKIEATYETTIISNENQDGALKKLSTKRAQEIPGAALDPVRAVQNLPGVNRSPGFGSQVIIQGSAPQDTRYNIDGHEIPLIFHFGGLSSVLMPELSSSIDYLSAGYQAPYGRAMGGVIQLNSANPESKHAKGMAFVDIFNVGGAAEVPLGENQSLSFGTRASYVGAVLKQVAKNADNFSLTVAPSFNDLGIIYKNDLSKNLMFKTVVIGSIDNLEFVLDESPNGDPLVRGGFSNQTAFFRIIPQLEWTHSSDSKTKISLGIGRDFIDTKIGEQFFKLKTKSVSIRADHQSSFNETWKSNIGIDSNLDWADLDFKLPQFFDNGGIADPISTTQQRVATLRGVQNHAIGLYWNHQIKPSIDSRWTFTPGLRFDYFSEITQPTLSPRVAARYQLSPNWALISAGGIYTQAPQPQFSSPEYGNTNLTNEYAYHWTFKTERDLSAEWSTGSNFTSGVFARWFRQLVIPNPPTLYDNLGQGRAFGFENSVQYNARPWSIFAAYTLSRSTRSDPERSEYLFQYDQTHFLTLIGSVDLPRNWRISTRFRYVTGPLNTIPTGSALDTDNDVYIPITGSLFGDRLRPFIMADLRIDKKWIYDTWTLSFYADIQNVLNRGNPESLQFSYDYRLRKEVTGIPILPTIGLKGEF